MLTLRWKKAVCTHARAFSSQVPLSWGCLNPPQWPVTGFHNRPGHRARGLTSLPLGGCGPRAVDVKVASCSWAWWACWCTPSSWKGTSDKSSDRPQDQNQTGEMGLWLDVNGEEINIWLEAGREKKAMSSVSVSHFPMQGCMEERGGHTDQRKALREKRKGLAVPGHTAGTSVGLKEKRLWQGTGKEQGPAGQGGQSEV